VRKIDVKKLFGASVRYRRHELGLSQEEVADRAQLHRTYLCDVERGARNVSLENIDRIAHALQVPVSGLFSHPEYALGGEPRASGKGGGVKDK
jgi:transcriptional regulator with XRE-family HTH domain